MLNDPRIALQSLIVPPSHPKARPGYAYARGDEGFVDWALPALATNLPLGQQLLWVDAAQRFDPRHLIKAADAWAIDKFYFLNRVQLARPHNYEEFERFMLSEVVPASRHGNPVVLVHPLALWQGVGVAEGEERFARLREMLAATAARCLVLDEAQPPNAYSRPLQDGAARVGVLQCADGQWKVLELSEKLAVKVKLPS